MILHPDGRIDLAKTNVETETGIRFDCEDVNKSCQGSNGYCHPSAVLRAMSEARVDENVDPVSRNAVVAVDVGDVTLVGSSDDGSCLGLCACIW